MRFMRNLIDEMRSRRPASWQTRQWMPAAGDMGGRHATESAGHWRLALLQTALIASAGLLAVFGALGGLLLSPRIGWLAVAVGLSGSALLVVTARRARWGYRVRALVLVGVLFATGVVAIGLGGFAPAPVLAAMWAVVTCGLLFGRRAMYVLWALLVAALLGAGAWRGAYEPLMTAPDMAPDRFAVWVRVALVFTATAIAMGLSVRSAMRSLEATVRQRSHAARAAAAALEAELRWRSARLATEQELQDAQRLEAVGHLSGGLAHRLINAFTVIELAIAELRAGSFGSARAAAAAERVDAAWLQAARTAGQLLAFSRPAPKSTGIVQLDDLVRECEPVLRAALPEDRRLLIEANGDRPVSADATRLRQVILNVVLHARDRSPPGGEIRVRVGAHRATSPHSAVGDSLAEGDYATVDVTLSGATAVDPAALLAPRFEGEGGGLGLFTTLGIVRNAGGTIDSVDDATTLRIYWPLARPRASPAETPSPQPPAPPPPAAPSQTADPDRELAAWRVATLRLIARLAIPLYLVALIIVYVSAPQLLARVGLVFGACVALLVPPLVWRSMPLAWRAIAVFGGIMGVGAILVTTGVLAPNTFALSAAGVMLAAALGGVRGLVLGTAIAVGFILLAGALVGGGVVAPAEFEFDPSRFGVWARIACMSALVFVLTSALIVHIIERLERASGELARARATLVERLETAQAERDTQLATERALAAAERLGTVGRLAGSVAHDVNNALTVIGSWIPMIAGPQASPDMAPAGIEAIEEAVTQAVAVTRQLTADGAHAPMRKHYCDLREAVERAARTLAHVLPDDVRITIEASDAVVRVDPAAVGQILLNLALNGRDAMPEGGVITLHAGAVPDQPGRALLEVADTGTGMEAAVAARAFEAFFTTKPAGRGTGLGLPNVRRIVEATGGDIDLQTAPQQGTRIRMTWPRAQTPSRPRTETGASTTIPPGGLHVLLAEDDDLVRESMVFALHEGGCRVTPARDGDAAARLLDTTDPIDVFCVDAVMPGIPTATLIEHCQRRHREAAILVCSGYLPETLSRPALPNRVDYLIKPFSADELVAFVANLHADRPAR